MTAVRKQARVASRGRMRNYLSQLRLYSYADLLLMLAALGASGVALAQCSLLWFAFLIHLEWRHRDRGRLLWPWWSWTTPAAIGLALQPTALAIPFLVMSALYASKKALPAVAAVSPLVNGGIKGGLALLVSGATPAVLAAIVALTGVRNLLGDLRDVEKDRAEGVVTIPVRLGARSDVRWAYPAALAGTSAVWTIAGGLPAAALLAAWAVQAATYGMTPR